MRTFEYMSLFFFELSFIFWSFWPVRGGTRTSFDFITLFLCYLLYDKQQKHHDTPVFTLFFICFGFSFLSFDFSSSSRIP